MQKLIINFKNLENSFAEFSSNNKFKITNLEKRNKSLNDLLSDSDFRIDEIEKLYKKEKDNLIDVNKKCDDYKNTINDARNFIYELETHICDKNKEIEELRKVKYTQPKQVSFSIPETIKEEDPISNYLPPKVVENNQYQEEIKELKIQLDECHNLLSDYQTALSKTELLNKQLEEHNIKIEKDHLEFINNLNKKKPLNISLHDELDYIGKQIEFERLKNRNKQLESEILKHDLESVNNTTPLLKSTADVNTGETIRCCCNIM